MMKSEFLNRLDVRIPFAVDNTRVLLKPLWYNSEYAGQTIVVPEGFKTDYASVPRPLWGILPPHGKYVYAAVLHDYLYQFNPLGMTRKDADHIFHEAMNAIDVGPIKHFFMHSGVRVGGWWAWNGYRKEDSSGRSPDLFV